MRETQKHYVVKVSLPYQEVEVWARSESDAKVKAFNMIGMNGIAHFGVLKASPLSETAA